MTTSVECAGISKLQATTQKGRCMCIILQNVSAARICASHDDMAVTFVLKVELFELISSPCNDVSVVEEHITNRSLCSTCKTWGMPLMLAGIYMDLDKHVSQPGALLRVV